MCTLSKKEQRTMSTKATKVSEADKRADPTKYIENPSSGKMVLRDSATGKKILEAQKSGKHVEFSESKRIQVVIEALKTHCNLKDEDIAEALKSMVDDLPRGSLLLEWGGSTPKSKSPGDKKKPSTAYNYFVKDVVVPKGENRMKVAASAWSMMSDEDKEPYVLLAKASKEENEAEETMVIEESDDVM